MTEEARRILRRCYEVGSDFRLDMTQAQTLLAQAQAALHALEEAHRQPQRACVAGRPASGHGPRVSGRDGNAHAQCAAHRFAFRSAHPSAGCGGCRATAESRQRQYRRDPCAFLSNVQITGAFDTASSQFDGLFADGRRAWTFTPTIALPLLHGGRNRVNLDLVEAHCNIAVANDERTIQAAFRDLADALAHRKGLAAQMASTREMLAALQERAGLANIRFENGRSAYLEVLDDQRDLFETEQALVQLRPG